MMIIVIVAMYCLEKLDAMNQGTKLVKAAAPWEAFHDVMVPRLKIAVSPAQIRLQFHDYD